MTDYRGRKAIISCDIPEISNLSQGNIVVILDERWVGEGLNRKRKFLIRPEPPNGEKYEVNETDLRITDEIVW